MAVYTVVQVQRFYSEQWAKLENARYEFKSKNRISYFNNDKIQSDVCAYDTMFHPTLEYDQYIHRSDTINLKKLRENIFKEERKKPVSVLTSFDYGRLTVPFEFPGMYEKKHNTTEEFYQKCHLNFKANSVGLASTFALN